MEKGIRHYLLFLKYQIRKPLLWISLACMLLMVYYLQTVALPGAENTTVLICGANDAETGRFLEMAKETDTIFQYEAAEEEELIQRVMEGSADCGFIWKEEILGEGLWERDAVTQVTGTFTNKGLLAKETTFSILLRLKGEVLPLSAEEQIFGGKDEEREEIIRNRYEELLGMDSLFTIDFRNANYEQEADKEKGYLGKTDIVRGMVALLLFMYCLFGFGVDTLSAEKKPWNYLSKGPREQMLWSNLLARMTIPGIFGFILIRCMAQPGDFGPDLLKYLGFLFYSLVWCRVIGSIFRRRESYAATFLIILLLHLFLCPIFFDAQMLSPVLGRLGYLLPTGWYLR